MSLGSDWLFSLKNRKTISGNENMLTKLSIENFKRFSKTEIELGNPVVFIGPNNSGKTTALQALALWEVGVRKWHEKHGATGTPKKPGVTLNRKDLLSLPVPIANLLWNDLHTVNVDRSSGKPNTDKIFIRINVSGSDRDRQWTFGMEFYYANPESFYCRPIRFDGQDKQEMLANLLSASDVQVAFLPPMSGLATNETKLEEGAINVQIGQGRTAEVLRNLCYSVYENNSSGWERLKTHVERLFRVKIDAPEYLPDRGEITMSYREGAVKLDLCASGRGLQQTLLIIAYMYARPNTVLLFDEPDAHLEILRQREIYQLLCDIGEQTDSQVIAASHSEVLLNEAAERGLVIAFVGEPHRIDGQGSQVLKSLREFGYDQYFLAEQTKCVLYLEGSTDLAILREFAKVLGHKRGQESLARPFVHYVGNQPSVAAKHFYALKEAVPELEGIAIFDRLDPGASAPEGFTVLTWNRREIENYVCTHDTLMNYANGLGRIQSAGPLFDDVESTKHVQAMQEAIDEIEDALNRLGNSSPWDEDTKVSDDFLIPLFRTFFEKLAIPNQMPKRNFNELARYVPKDQIDAEIVEKLDAISSIIITPC